MLTAPACRAAVSLISHGFFRFGQMGTNHAFCYYPEIVVKKAGSYACNQMNGVEFVSLDGHGAGQPASPCANKPGRRADRPDGRTGSADPAGPGRNRHPQRCGHGLDDDLDRAGAAHDPARHCPFLWRHGAAQKRAQCHGLRRGHLRHRQPAVVCPGVFHRIHPGQRFAGPLYGWPGTALVCRA